MEKNKLAQDDGVLLFETQPYGVSVELYRDGYHTFQKRYLLRKSRIMGIVLLLCMADFLFVAVRNFIREKPVNSVLCVLIVLCAALLFSLWYNPRKARRSVAETVSRMQDDRYAAMLREDAVIIRTVAVTEEEAEGEQDEPRTLPADSVLSYDSLTVWEKELYYLICQGKQMFYILPKSAFAADQTETLQGVFREKLGDRFRSLHA